MRAMKSAGADPGAANGMGATFQYFFFRPRDELLTFEARRGRDAVRDWLRMHHIPIEGGPAH